jgi:hypothetical protein
VSTTIGYILYGVEKTSLGGSNYSYTAGAIYFNGEVYLVDAIASISITTADILTITTTNDPTADPVTFTDGTPRSVHNIRKLVISNGTLGTGNVNYADLVRILTNYQYDPSDAEISANTGTWTMAGTDRISIRKVGKFVCLNIDIRNSNMSAASVGYAEYEIPTSIGQPDYVYTGYGYFNNSQNSNHNVDAVGDKGRGPCVLQTNGSNRKIRITLATYNNFYTVPSTNNNIDIQGQIFFYVS